MPTARITVDPHIRWGTPLIRDTGISVASVIALDRAGLDLQAIVESYPGLEAADVLAARDWLADHGDAGLTPSPPPPGTHHPRVAVDPRVQGGVPVVRGTRIPVDVIIGLSEEGYTPGEIVEQYPTLAAEDVADAVAYHQEAS